MTCTDSVWHVYTCIWHEIVHVLTDHVHLCNIPVVIEM